MDAVWAGIAEWKAKERHHIAATWSIERDGGLVLYADGELVASNAAAMWEFDPGHPVFSVGGQGGAITTNGVIGELVIYNYVLSEEEVKEHFNAVRPLGDGAAVEAVDKLATTWGHLKDQ